MKKYKILIIILFVAATALPSCSKWLSVQPSDRQTEEQLYSTKDGLFSALNGIYTKIGSEALYGNYLSYGMIEVMARRYVPHTSNALYSSIVSYQYSSDKATEAITRIWTESYSTILNCNVFMRNLKNSKSLMNQSDMNLLEGEMLGLRAFLHFDMLRLFGPIYLVNPKGKSIPYNESADIQVTDILTAEDVLQNYILRDIELAEKLLANDAVKTLGAALPNKNSQGVYEAADNITNFRQLRFNYFAIQLLKARVYLYMGKKEEALTAAKNIIENPNMPKLFPFIDPSKLLGNNYDPDRTFSTEVFFGLYKKNRNDIYRLNFDNESSTLDLLQPRNNYVKTVMFKDIQFDYRFQTQWVTTASTSNQQPTLAKYKKLDITGNLPFFATFMPMMRLSEAYLIAAECEPNEAKAYEYFNILYQGARGNTPKEVGTKAALSKDIIREYLREFFGEGQAFYLFKRLNINMDAEFNGNANASYTLKNNTARLVLPYPEGEIAPR